MLDTVNSFVYHSIIVNERGGVVRQKELIRWLSEQGATFTEGKKHTIAHLNGKKAPIPRSAKEIKHGTYKGILDRLGLK